MTALRKFLRWFQPTLALAAGSFAIIHILQKGMSGRWLIAAVFCLGLAAAQFAFEQLARNEFLSALMQTAMWAIVFVSSFFDDKTFGFRPAFFGILFLWSGYISYLIGSETKRDQHPS